MSRIQDICIVGTGTIGASWAAFYASKGLCVRLTDSNDAALASGLEQARSNIRFLRDKELIDADAATDALDHLLAAPDLADAASAADFVHESIAENYDIKQDVYRQLDALTAPDVLLASSSSGLLMTRIQSVMQNPGRALIAHPFNPPHLIPLVELVGGKQTTAESIERARAFFDTLGKTPVVLNREVPGHIANRLAAALWREAIDLVASGVASVEDVDKALYAGPGMRWAFMGQHLIYHLGGGAGGYRHFIDQIGTSFERYYEDMASWQQIPEDAKEAIVAGAEDQAGARSLAELASWRDDQLVKLLKALGTST